MELKKGIEILPLGEAALLVNFEQRIDLDINSSVVHLAKKLKSVKLKGVTFIQPTYCSLSVGFDQEEIDFKFLQRFILMVYEGLDNAKNIGAGEKKAWKIPVCYDGEFALDMDELVSVLKLPKKEIVELHTSINFRVYMLGFLPGFPYLGKLPESLECPRKAIPRKKVPALSVGLAGMQTGIYPMAAPGGWQIVGRTPIKIMDANRESPFLLKAGDEVNFYPISENEFWEIKKESAVNKFDYNSLHARIY